MKPNTQPASRSEGGEDLLCPSALGHEGAIAIAEGDKNGSMSFLDQPLPVTSDFVLSNTDPGRSILETKFRFASPCIERKCANWNRGV